MSLHLIKGEKILWKSYPGKNYRTFLFIRDFAITLIISILIHTVLKDADINFLVTIGTWKITALVFFIGAVYTVFHQVSFLFSQFIITNERIIIKKGFISRKMTSIKHEHIHDIKVIQSISERILRIGNVYLFTANDSNSSEGDVNPFTKVPCLEQIDHPFKIHGMIEELVEKNIHNTNDKY